MGSGRYLILRLSALGDVIFAMESLAALKAAEPEACVDWLVEDRASGLLAQHPGLDRVLEFPRKSLSHAIRRPWRWPTLVATLWSFARDLRSRRYDAVLDLHGNLKSSIPMLLARASRKIGFDAPRARDLSWLAARERVRIEPRSHRADQNLRIVARLLGREPEAGARPLLPEHSEAAERAAAFLREVGGAGPTVCIAPGASVFAAFKRWPARRYRELALRLHGEGIRVVVCTGPGEEALGAEITQATALPTFEGGREGLGVFLEVLRAASVVVAADSGPLHMAQAVATKAVALFGPKDPAIYGPRHAGSIVLRYPTGCAPCGRRRCDAPICVQGIPVDAVHAAVRELLDGAP